MSPPANTGPAYLANGNAGGKSGRNLSGLVRAGVVVAVLGAGGLGAYNSRNDVSIDEITMGTCLVAPTEELLATVTTVDCVEPHDMEVYSVEQLSVEFSFWPGQESIDDSTFERCFKKFETLIGSDYMESPYDFNFIAPVKEGWDAGSTTSTCLLVNYDGTPMVGPFRDQ